MAHVTPVVPQALIASLILGPIQGVVIFKGLHGMDPGYLLDNFILMGLACPTHAGRKGMLWSQGILASGILEKNFLCHSSHPLEHCAPPQSEIYPFGLMKGPEDLALPTGLGPQWECVILDMINGLR